MTQAGVVFFGGRYVPYDQARLHVMSPAVKFATSVHDAICAYPTPDRRNLLLFRIDDHVRRLAASARAIGLGLPTTTEQLIAATTETIRRNGFRDVPLHIRISLHAAADDGYLDAGGNGVLAIVPIPRTTGVAPPLRVTVSMWRRNADTASPPRVKAAANYLNSRLALLDAQAGGYDDAILLNQAGRVTEGPGYNLFLVRDGIPVTPPPGEGALDGVTRDTIMRLLAHEHGLRVDERLVHLSELTNIDEAFFCGSWKEVAPIASIGAYPLKDPAPGDVTRLVARTYRDAVCGRLDDYDHWLTPVR